eukprot:CAMPEP_0175738058 /NCGR_PEP_ID=MMETSP0097-20121207/54276_1 /TAXON_ID=311494 /ORGANISM="Alexandrium monilatum, Strain CCMP3105" /LENGTH=68 /DNA_ID=CAMNT_0017046245 /DNA_START=27 /DNA_END=229 /DNA_ORIENTATION=-
MADLNEDDRHIFEELGLGRLIVLQILDDLARQNAPKKALVASLLGGQERLLQAQVRPVQEVHSHRLVS